MKHQIIVGNLGTVYDGDSFKQARIDFANYRDDSRNNYGKVAGERVTWMKDGELYKEHAPAAWDYEHTDTFGGEANYNWVKRGTVRTDAKNPVRAVKKALGMEGVPCRRSNYGDMIELRPIGVCQVIFITWHEEEI